MFSLIRIPLCIGASPAFPLPVNIMVGMPLLVEGKSCLTGMSADLPCMGASAPTPCQPPFSSLFSGTNGGQDSPSRDFAGGLQGFTPSF